jgi:hypothetical protein
MHVCVCFILIKIKQLHYSLSIPTGKSKEHIRIWNVAGVQAGDIAQLQSTCLACTRGWVGVISSTTK